MRRTKDISKYETSKGTKDAIEYFYNEKEKAIENLQSEINTKEAIIFILKDKADAKDKVLKKYIEYFVDKEME